MVDSNSSSIKLKMHNSTFLFLPGMYFGIIIKNGQSTLNIMKVYYD
jgi:hypothetical protein